MSKAAKIEKVTKPHLVDPSGKPLGAKGEKPTQVPEPRGWRILIAIPEVEDTTAGGIIKADSTKQIEQTATVVGLVLKMGGQCYNDVEKFGPEPWCKEGDFVLIGAYKGVRFNVHGTEFRIINDDTVQAVIDDPRGYSRA